ncbi:hypothetical protein LNTAR_15607 [Lentisphaera araneosa HTCC2155]|uniref:Uncharacterized protein n=1 Tax=Lentisphaera araneosa HTCC2155 TaxID=313628 RepID=A6DMB9_9BACT|nr:hypothetical protein LNTAR_15607 [Lentisphaera araneosa HTCC2155]
MSDFMEASKTYMELVDERKISEL